MMSPPDSYSRQKRSEVMSRVRSKGRPPTADNLQLLCGRHNRLKGDRLV
jgi:hypothetical protein